VNFVRFSSGEALARLIAEKNTPRVDVLFGGPVETFAAGAKEGIFEPYRPPAYAALPARFKAADGSWVAIADDPLVFMTNAKFLQGAQPQAAGVVGGPAESRLQEHAADGRRAHVGHGRHAHLLHPGGQRPRRDQGLRVHEEEAAQRAALHQSGGGGTLPVGLGQAGGGIFFIVDALDTKAKATTSSSASPRRASAPRRRPSRSSRAPRIPELGKKLIDWASSRRHAEAVRDAQDQLRAGPSRGRVEPGLARCSGAKIFPIDDAYAGANRKRTWSAG